MTPVLPLPLAYNTRYTTFFISVGKTLRIEFTLSQLLPVPVLHADYPKYSDTGTHLLGSQMSKNSRSHLDLLLDLSNSLILPGWNYAIKTDQRTYAACQIQAALQFAATPKVIRKLVGQNLNPNFTGHDTVLAYPLSVLQMPQRLGIPVFPESPSTDPAMLEIRQRLELAA